MSDEETILLALPFTESTCEACGSEGAVGVCPDCGGARPDNSHTDPLLDMRRRALTGVDERVGALAVELESNPAGHVACTGLQYGMVLADSEVLGKWRGAREAFKQLHGLDLGDTKVVGSTLRRRVVALVEQAEAAIAVRRDLMWFVPPRSCLELREMLEVLARAAVGLACTTVQALTGAHGEASRLVPSLQNYLDEPVDFERFCELLDVLEREPDSLDDRIGVALGLAGAYTDQFGRLDFARVLAAYADSDEPLLELSRRVSGYLRHVICDPQALGSVASILALPASALASLDRPLIGHRVASEFSALLWRAHATNARLTRELVERTLDDSPRLLAALARAETTQRRIALDIDATTADTVDDLVELYATAAETGFRSYSWLALDLGRLVNGEGLVSGQAMPMLGQIAQQLSASAADLAGLLSQAVSPQLRNAAKHEGYAVDADGASVDMRDATLDADELQLLAQKMVACVAGMDAAIAAWGLESGLLLEVSALSDDSAGADYARRVITRSLLQVAGGELVSVSWGTTVTLVARIRRPLVRAGLLNVLAGISPLWPEAEQLEMRDESGSPIVAASGESFTRCREAGPETLAIAALYGVFDAAVFAGEDGTEAAQDAVAVMIRLFSPETMEDAEPDSNEARLRILAARAAATRSFIAAHSLGSSRRDDEFSSLLRRAETAAAAAARGDQGAFPRLLKALTPLFEWTTQRRADFFGFFDPW